MSHNVEEYVAKWSFTKKLALIVILGGILLSLPSLCQSHGGHDNPSFKYSREANENFDPKKVPVHDHHHHGHHDHGHHHHGHHDHHDHGHHPHGHHDHAHKASIKRAPLGNYFLYFFI